MSDGNTTGARESARRALLFLLTRVTTCTSVPWDRQIRQEFGDDIADEAIAWFGVTFGPSLSSSSTPPTPPATRTMWEDAPPVMKQIVDKLGRSVIARPIDRCGNIRCPNRAEEGKMSLVSAEDGGVASRAVTLILCMPCASVLLTAMKASA